MQTLRFRGYSGSDVTIGRPFDAAPSFLLGWLSAEAAAGTNASPRDRVVAGAAGVDAEDVRIRTFGEFVERWSGLDTMNSGCATTSPVLKAGDRADPAAFLSSKSGDREFSDPGSFRWRLGTRATTGAPAALPVAHLGAGSSYRFPLGSSGYAAHPDESHARLHALQEIVERDALMLSWRVPGWPERRVRDNHLPRAYVAILDQLDLRVELFTLGTPPLPRTVLALVHTDGERLTCGSAVRDRESDAAVTALNEALMLQWTAGCSAPARSLRGPLQSPRDSLEHVVRAYRNGQPVLSWYTRQAARWDRAGLEEARQDFSALALSVEAECDCPVILLDATSEEAREAGWQVWQCAAAGAARKEPDNSPTLPTRRLLAAAKRWTRREEAMNAEPHPFG